MRASDQPTTSESLEDVDFAEVDRLLFTFSYVAHQRSVAPAHIDAWASVIKRAVGEVDRAVELIYTTAGPQRRCTLRPRADAQEGQGPQEATSH